jgi:lipoprotein-anchoring transpeptidase ErfK/SrfK
VLLTDVWIDVDLKSQTLVAYAGEKPLFATLVSTGVGAPGSAFATPLGLHRVMAKLRTATMDNLEHTNVAPYHYETVPHTQYIGRVALHGVFWHDGFGQPKSHGCINLSLADADYLFELTMPTVPSGSHEARGDQGTTVQIR